MEGEEILALTPLLPVLRPALPLVPRLNLVKQEDDKETLLPSQQLPWESFLGTALDLFGKNMSACPLG